MKKTIFSNIALLLVTVAFQSCLKEDNVANPTVESAKFYTVDATGKFTEVTDLKAGTTYTIGVKTTADICSVWPGGERIIMKKKGTAIDSLDINNKVLLTKSNCYTDYGLLNARGLTTSLNSTINGWVVAYKYPTAGTFSLTVLVTNHAYDSSNYNQIVFDAGKVTIK